MNKEILILLSIILILYIYHIWEKYVFSSKYLISSNKAKKLLKEKYFDFIIDVRTNLEYNLGHYKGAINIPISTITKEINKIIKNKNAKLLIYCNTGNRARQATDYLINMGYKNVNYISGLYTSLK